MAIGIYFSLPAMSAAKDDECIRLLKKVGAGNPVGITRQLPRLKTYI